MRTFDLATLRAFVGIVEAKSMTRAAQRLNLTQSAISMQIKRLEESLDQRLFDRGPGGMTPTGVGQQLMGYAQRLLALNDEGWSRLTEADYQGTIRLGVAFDLVRPHVPEVLKVFARKFPSVQVQLSIGYTVELMAGFDKGDLDFVLTTERDEEQKSDHAVHRLANQPLVWIGAKGGSVWRQQPMPLGVSNHCIFRPSVIEALNKSARKWSDVVESQTHSANFAMIEADLCVGAQLVSWEHPGHEVVDHGGALPVLPDFSIFLHSAIQGKSRAFEAFEEELKAAFA